ncbi:MAG: PSD1 and planctomycete cytochrome C domain-containing protein [Rubripirellula sp.]
MFSVRSFALLSLVMVVSPLHADELAPDQVKFFETKIRPVLIKECYGCHSNQAGNARGGLRLDTKELTLIGGSSGPAIVPGDLDESLLYNAIVHEDFVMPPKRKLSDKVIEDFRKWIQMGAPDPRVRKVAKIRPSISAEDIEQAKESFWAYKKPVKQSLPDVEDDRWPNTPLDKFVLAKIEQSGLKPAEDAQAYKVLRRLSFDLVGLPPTPQQIAFFNKQWKESPDQAVAYIVDQLLEKEQFGERWGRHWLDVARFGESTGREVNMTFPHAWRYRDYVIDSFNEDKPFDRFVQEQVAGDLLPAKTDEDWTRNLIATSFLAIGPKNVNEQNRVQFAADLVDEQIDATTRVFMGTSVACARCHDHKFDPIPQTDYYALAGVFGSATTYWGIPPSEFGNFTTAQTKRTSSLLLLPVDDPSPFDKRYSRDELAELKTQFSQLRLDAAAARRARSSGTVDAQAAIRARLRTSNELSALSGKLAVVDENGQPRSYCMGVQEKGNPEDARLLVRGEIDQPAQTVRRGFPQVLCSTSPTIDQDSSGRLEFARWIGSSENPLTARVMVNRIWQHLIGQGIVTSTENFGSTGQAPSHPELLDYLAVEFMESDWSVKSMVRLIATSHVYRISSDFDQRDHEYDPDNTLVWRANPRRLDAEAIRDAMLSISGEIDFDRPRGSEVAKAGYVRVRDGILGDPREAFRRAAAGATANRVRESFRTSRGGNDGGGSRFGGNGMQRGGQRFRSEGASRQSGGSPNAQTRNNGQNSRFGGTDRPGQTMGRSMFGGRRTSQGMAGTSMRDFASSVTNALDMEGAKFRSVYLPMVRDEEPRSLEVFDLADSSTVTGMRESSNTANQALYMMNNRFVIQQSNSFARRILQERERSGDRIGYAFTLAYGRPPTSGERSATSAFVRSFAAGARPSEDTLSAFCQSLLASAEFRYID